MAAGRLHLRIFPRCLIAELFEGIYNIKFSVDSVHLSPCKSMTSVRQLSDLHPPLPYRGHYFARSGRWTVSFLQIIPLIIQPSEKYSTKPARRHIQKPRVPFNITSSPIQPPFLCDFCAVSSTRTFEYNKAHLWLRHPGRWRLDCTCKFPLGLQQPKAPKSKTRSFCKKPPYIHLFSESFLSVRGVCRGLYRYIRIVLLFGAAALCNPFTETYCAIPPECIGMRIRSSNHPFSACMVTEPPYFFTVF